MILGMKLKAATDETELASIVSSPFGMAPAVDLAAQSIVRIVGDPPQPSPWYQTNIYKGSLKSSFYLHSP
jgi:hypothetical protein